MTLYLYQVRDWLKVLKLPVDYFYIGKLDAKKEKSLGVYSMKADRAARYVIGGDDNKTYQTKQVSLLAHFNKNQRETEAAAYSIYEKIKEQRPEKIGEASVNFIRMLNEEPVDVATDEQGIYEFVIEFEINYKKDRRK